MSLVRIICGSQKPSASVIFLHGLGDSADGWTDTFTNMFLPKFPHIRFILPTANAGPITRYENTIMNRWFDIPPKTDNITRDNVGGLDESIKQVNNIIQKEIMSNIKQERIIIGGFSQGGALSICAGLETKLNLAGILCLSGFVPYFPIKIGNKNTVCQMYHGVEDKVIPLSWCIKSKDYLLKEGVNASLKTYHMEHTAIDEEIEDIIQFIGDKLPPI